MTIKIISSIHYEALLLWKKGAIYRKRNNKIKTILVTRNINEYQKIIEKFVLNKLKTLKN